ncbi:lipopolysaccharide-induced tumor necrosis factor-alpha factor homolog [Rhopalosiphum maidis]|uniref:lipopolysaccharide-induced tumor necrosis factor-alpha factor homolog n=1 Tax=Rhopalosiphum maidis TaxID=43146 RepID=UPI000F009532|nr:lipopolysaccharide-induced tumor necrosis factor-alpha factor homolog [Rhopalosiphum maidis]
MSSIPPQNIQWVQSPALAPPLGPDSIPIICTSCGQSIFTSTSRKAKAAAWWSCMLLSFCGCCFGCCLIPCCLHSCNVVNHTCPNCNAYLGQYRP